MSNNVIIIIKNTVFIGCTYNVGNNAGISITCGKQANLTNCEFFESSSISRPQVFLKSNTAIMFIEDCVFKKIHSSVQIGGSGTIKFLGHSSQ